MKAHTGLTGHYRLLHFISMYYITDDLSWHGAAGGKRCSSESIFLEAVGFV